MSAPRGASLLAGLLAVAGLAGPLPSREHSRWRGQRDGKTAERRKERKRKRQAKKRSQR